MTLATERFRDLTLHQFLARLSSSAPAPGGGSAAAVAASLGASLVVMVAGLSEGREKYAAHGATHALGKAAGMELADRLLRIADEDAAAYESFALAMKLPRENDAEKAARADAIRRAARTASEVPFRCVEACRDVARAAEALAGRSNRNAASDLSVAVLLAEAAVHGAGENVFVNLPSIGDEAFAVDLRARTEQAIEETVALAARVRELVAAGEEREPLAGASPA